MMYRRRASKPAEADIRRRYRHSPINLGTSLPVLTELRVYDNSATGQAPQPVLMLHLQRGRIVGPPDLTATPAWAKPIVAAALDARRGSNRETHISGPKSASR